jgi:hypothetical protein
VRRRLVLRRRSLSVEQQHDTLPEPERETPASEAERLETKHVLVEPLHLVLVLGCVVQNGLEHAGEPQIFGHDANVLVLTRRRQRNWSGLQACVVARLICDKKRQPRPGGAIFDRDIEQRRKSTPSWCVATHSPQALKARRKLPGAGFRLGLADHALLRHNRAAVRSDEVSRELAALEEEVAALQAAEQEEHAAVAALEAQLSDLRHRLSLARGALAHHERQIEEKRAELEEAIAQEAQERFGQVLQDRDAAAAALAEAAEVLFDRLAALDRSQDAVRSAWATAQAGRTTGPASDLQVPPEIAAEPEVMREPWERLCHEIRTRIGERFEDELVDAASRSPLGSAINDLPLHLRDLARRRRHAMIRRGQDAEAENGNG